ncbi:hypothetical protein [Cellulosimicrobium cellulans]|uniref:hypothetical protein n=1 Tax=Cellulosimicrobium cellulans TaxID=1710 RepID=UPI00130D98E4|nr:hypothetical protein [Cellulosimicrobium cellulans]
MRQQHLLEELKFPSRYERLVDQLGTDVARLLVSPGAQTHDEFEAVAYAIDQGDEGLLCPMYALPGTGKTTLAQNLGSFHKTLYGPTLKYSGDLTTTALSAAVRAHRAETMAANDERLTPVNIDSREALPPAAMELAEIKQFLRTSDGAKVAILWPTTKREVAQTMSRQFEEIAGTVPVHLPLEVQGPPVETWRNIAADTVRLVNHVDSLELLINPADYDPNEHTSIGSYLRAMSGDFMKRRLELLRSTRKPLSLTIVFGSESNDAGILSQLTSSTRYGLLDGSALVGITKDSTVGQWWDARRGLLTQTIVQLDAHAFALSPTTTIAMLRQFGNEDVRRDLATLNFKPKGTNACRTSIGRSDLGRHLAGERRSAYEARGNPGDASVTAFGLLVENGLINNNRDRLLNKSIAMALHDYLGASDSTLEVVAERSLDGTSLIPDVSIITDKMAHGIEYAWRTGDYLVAKNRSACAIYILTKLKNYATSMGWAGTA